jgi:hypothetical protein
MEQVFVFLGRIEFGVRICPTLGGSAESGELTLEFSGVWQFWGAIFKNQPKLEIAKIAGPLNCKILMEQVFVFWKEWNLGLEFADPSGKCRIRRITAGISRNLPNSRCIFKNEPKLQFSKIATKAFLRNGISYL